MFAPRAIKIRAIKFDFDLKSVLKFDHLTFGLHPQIINTNGRAQVVTKALFPVLNWDLDPLVILFFQLEFVFREHLLS